MPSQCAFLLVYEKFRLERLLRNDAVMPRRAKLVRRGGEDIGRGIHVWRISPLSRRYSRLG